VTAAAARTRFVSTSARWHAGTRLSPPVVPVRRTGDESTRVLSKGGSTMTTTITRRTELAHRASDGIDVYLFWNEPTNRVTVGVLDAGTDDGFELEVGHIVGA
jgi:hypothetical protein